ncbi:MAG: STAS domain-containing protein [Magnetococcales bacterium]|nr:STAS domain-containing protein [Magnetococcales bacterium]MBF0115344.1 STAS domain-containing protein [Magnetococcales bacterium]
MVKRVVVKDHESMGQTIVVLEKKFDFESHTAFRNAYQGFPDATQMIVVDLSKVENLDSSAVGMLLMMHAYVKSRFGNRCSGIRLITGTSYVKDVLNNLRVGNLFLID